jgi:hypothetical protein
LSQSTYILHHPVEASGLDLLGSLKHFQNKKTRPQTELLDRL